MKIHHLNCATMCPIAKRLIEGEGGYAERGRMVCHCLLIETEDGLVLVDTGFGIEDCRNPIARLGRPIVMVGQPRFDVAETAAHRVEALGFRRSDVRHIVVTHLDLDHAGGLPDFPDAEVHVHKLELDAAMARRTRAEASRYRPAHFQHHPKWVPHETAGERWNDFEAVRPLHARETDVLLVPLFGHTRGHCAVAVKADSGWLLHAGDAYFFRGEMENPPHCTPGLRIFQSAVETNRAMRLHNQERLRALRQRKGAEVSIFSAHDAREFEALRSGTR